MARQINFDRARVEWVTFKVEPVGPTNISMTAYGSLTNVDGISVPRNIEGWAKVSPATRAALNKALLDVVGELVAAELELESGDGLIREGITFRVAQTGETPRWVKP